MSCCFRIERIFGLSLIRNLSHNKSIKKASDRQTSKVVNCFGEEKCIARENPVYAYVIIHYYSHKLACFLFPVIGLVLMGGQQKTGKDKLACSAPRRPAPCACNRFTNVMC